MKALILLVFTLLTGRTAAAAEPLQDDSFNIEWGFIVASLLIFVLGITWIVIQSRVRKLTEELEEQRLICEELKSSEEKLSAIIHNTSSIIFVKDLAGIYQLVNKRFEQAANKTAEEIVGKSNIDFFSEETTARLKLNDQMVLDKDGVLEFEETIFFDGGIKTYIATKFPLKRENGETYAICGIATDITARKQIEEALSESQSMLADAERIARLGSWRFDRESKELVWSDAVYEIFGIPKDDFDGSYDDFLGVVYPDERDQVDHEYRDAVENDDTFGIEHRIIRRNDGAVRWVREKSTYNLDENGRFVSAHGTVQDITEQKNLERQLVRSQKMEAVGQLTGGVAHDFNNLLGIVEGNLDLLRRIIPAEETKLLDRIDPALRAVRRGADLTKKLLSFSRRKPQAATPTSLNDLLQETLTLLGKTLTDSITLNLNQQDDLWLTDIDAGDMEDAIINLALNARDAMDGYGNLSMETANVVISEAELSQYPDAKLGEFVKFSIQDTGGGIAKEIVHQIYDPFFTTKGNEKGTGLGLSMVYGFISRSNGFVHLETERGKGTTFHLFLPRSKSRGSQEKSLNRPHNDVVSDHKGTETILVVDDEIDLLEVISSELENAGYKVFKACSIDEAMEILDQGEAINLVLTDIVMPGKEDGLDLAAKVMRKYPEVRLMLTSGYSEKIFTLRVKENPVIAYLLNHLLSKPVPRDVLIPAVRQALDAVIAVQWSEKMAVGIQKLDEDHKVLVTLLNQLMDAVQNRLEHKVFMGICDSLLVYANSHFKREEVVMEACEYPHLDNHRKIHELLGARVLAFSKGLSENEDHKVVVEFVEFLREWFIDHTLGMDQTIIDYTEGKEEAIEAALESLET
ncbi:MAG: bacteriohemerythrin [Rhodospirillales bacterium]|nr:bacteriohemerythrin [Rhodospirillales bacterium]